MAFTLTTASAVLKDDYQPAVRDQLNNSNMLLSQVEKNTEDTVGTAAVLSVHVKRSAAVGPRPEGGTLPTAGNQSYTTERISLKYNYATIEISGPTIKLMASDRGAYVRAVESETKGIVRDLKRDVNRQLYTATTGVIGTTTGTPNTTTVNVDSKSTARRMEPGMKYDIVEAATDVVVMTVTLVSVSIGTTSSITYTQDSVGAGTAASGNRIVTQGVVPSGSYSLTGLTSIVSSSGTLHNINPSTYAVWKSYSATVSAAPTDTVFETALDEISIASGEDPNLAIVSHAGARAYAASLKTLKRFSGAPLELKGGFKAVTVQTGRQEIALWAERDCDESTCYIVNTAHLIEFYASDWEWMDEDGAVLARVAGKDAYGATLFKYHEFATDQRNTHGVLLSLTV